MDSKDAFQSTVKSAKAASAKIPALRKELNVHVEDLKALERQI